MEDNNSCLNCIWADQCKRNKRCEYYDNGQDFTSYNDAKIEKYHKRKKAKFIKEYNKYLDEFENGL